MSEDLTEDVEPGGQEVLQYYDRPRKPSVVIKRRRTVRRNAHDWERLVFLVVLAGILTVTILGGIVAFFFFPGHDLQLYGSVLMSPVLGISGTVIGYYFGRKDRRRG